jgi:hypothetical protein
MSKHQINHTLGSWHPLLASTTAANQQAMLAAMEENRHQFMLDGRTMTFREFLDEVAPDQDSPMRTFLTLKYQR